MEHQKDTRDVKLTASEWSVLTCLWENSPRTVMQLVAALGERVGWAKSTTITTLRRMEEKGLVRVEQGERGKRYAPAVEREQATAAETHSFLAAAATYCSTVTSLSFTKVCWSRQFSA